MRTPNSELETDDRLARLADALPPGQLGKLTKVYRDLLDAIGEASRFDSASWLGESTCGAAVIVTQDDKVVSPEAQKELAKVLGRGFVFEVPGDHFACIKRPDEFNDVLVAACVGAQA